MTDSDTKRQNRTKGPLTERQMTILSRLADGERQREIAETLGCAPSYVSAEICLAVNKLGARTAQAAVARHSSYLAYAECAQVLLNNLVRDPIDEAEEHVNHVLRDIAAELHGAATRMMPT